MINEGRGNEKGDFYDFNQGKKTSLSITAQRYLDWFDPDGNLVIPKNIQNIGDIPIIWVIGEKDPTHTKKGGEGYAFDLAPSNPLNEYVVVKGGHFKTPRFAPKVVIPWIKKVAGR